MTRSSFLSLLEQQKPAREFRQIVERDLPRTPQNVKLVKSVDWAFREPYSKISLVPRKQLNGLGNYVFNDTVFTCYYQTKARDAFRVGVLDHAHAHKCTTWGTQNRLTSLQLQYNQPYNFKIGGSNFLEATPTIAGTYHKSFLILGTESNSMKDDDFTVHFQFSSASTPRKEGLIQENAEVYLQAFRPGKSINDEPELRGNICTIFDDFLGTEEYTNLLKLEKIKFTFMYVQQHEANIQTSKT